MLRADLTTYFLQVAEAVATRSTCLDKQVGCVLVDKDFRIIATGYNGTPSGLQNCCDLGFCSKNQSHKIGECLALHAEQNALLSCNTRDVVTCYCTLEPCKQCTLMLMNSGCKQIYYIHKTNPKKSGEALFIGQGKGWKQWPIARIEPL